MLSSLTTVTLFSVLLLSTGVLGLDGGYNSTATTTGGLLPQVPTVESTQTALVIPSTSAAATTTPVGISDTQPKATTESSATSNVATTPSTIVSAVVSTASYANAETTASSSQIDAPTTESETSSLSVQSPTSTEPNFTPEAPVTPTSDASLDVPSTTATTTPSAVSDTTPQVTTQPGESTTTLPPVASPVTETSATALITSDAATSAIFTYAPSSSTSEIDSVSTPLFTYAPSATTEAGATTEASSVQFTYAPSATSTTNPGGLLASYINSVVASSSVAGAETTNVLSETSGASVTAPAFEYAPSSATEQTAAATVLIGSSAVSFAPVPQSESEGESSTAPAAFIIGSQTASVGQTLTVDNTPVAVQTSAGLTQVYAGSAAYTYTPAVVTGAPTVLTVGLATVSQNAAGAYLLGSATLAPGSSLTQGSGASATVVGLETTGGTTQLVYQDASTTASAIAAVTAAPTVMTVGLAIVSQGSAGAYLLGSSTLTPGSFITEGFGSSQTIVGLNTADGTTQLVYQDASTTASSVLPVVTSAPSIMTVGSATISQDSAGAYMLGSLTLTAGASITQGSGASETVVALETAGGSTQLVYQDASTTITSAASSASPSIADSSLLIIGGHTYSIGPVSLNAKATGTASSAASGFVTSGVSGGAAGPTSTGGPKSQSAASSLSISMSTVALLALVLGFAALL